MSQKKSKYTKIKSPSQAEMSSIVEAYYSGDAALLLERTNELAQAYPQHSFPYEFMGLAYEMLGEIGQAIETLQKAAYLAPQDPEIQTNLGNLVMKTGDLAEAESHYKKAIRIKPSLFQAHNSLGLLLSYRSDFEMAEKHFKKALQIKPNYISAMINLGECLRLQKKYHEAEDITQKAINLEPNVAESYHNLGHILQAQGRNEEAELFYKKSLSISPNLIESHCNMAAIFNAKGNYQLGFHHAKEAISLNPEYIDAYNNLGIALKGLNNLDEAQSIFEHILEKNPGSDVTLNNIGNVYHQKGEIKKAIQYFQRAVHSKIYNTEAYSNLLLCYNFVDRGETLHHAIEYGEWLKRHTKNSYSNKHQNHNHEKLKVGFVSADFREHSVSKFLGFMSEIKQNNEFELFAYYNHSIEDDTTHQLRKYFDSWNNIFAKSDEEAAELIYQQEIDILIDLSGHTAGNRLPVFSYKPAPLQITWLGYFATTGIEEIDYILVDQTGVPEEYQFQFAEQVQYLPHTRLCFNTLNEAPKVSNLPALEKNQFTFGCFQHLSKTNDEVFSLWRDILNQVPHSSLRWQAMQFADETVKESTLQKLEAQGISRTRIHLLPATSYQDYLQAHAEVDVLLDTFPYTGGTTTCEALWMGVPTITLAGETLLSRQGASLLTAAGLESYVTNTKEEYVALACSVASRLEALSLLRQNLREQVTHSALFNQTQFAKDFSQTITTLWQQHFSH
ncbi:tetratricopeptide repeat protein [Aquaspirillum soli]